MLIFHLYSVCFSLITTVFNYFIMCMILSKNCSSPPYPAGRVHGHHLNKDTKNESYMYSNDVHHNCITRRISSCVLYIYITVSSLEVSSSTKYTIFCVIFGLRLVYSNNLKTYSNSSSRLHNTEPFTWKIRWTMRSWPAPFGPWYTCESKTHETWNLIFILKQ